MHIHKHYTLKQKSFTTILLALDINNWCTIYMQAFKVIKFWWCHRSRVLIVIISRVTIASSLNFCRLCKRFSPSMLKIRNLPISKLADTLKTDTSPFKIPNIDVDSNIIQSIVQCKVMLFPTLNISLSSHYHNSTISFYIIIRHWDQSN